MFGRTTKTMSIIHPDSTDISFDPMYVNLDSMDFKLQMYSPLIDAGDPNILTKMEAGVIWVCSVGLMEKNILTEI